MPVRNNGGCRRPGPSRQAGADAPELPPVETKEPPMRRWPHPVAAQRPPEPLTAELYELRCALTRQTQLLSDIRVLLEQQVADRSTPDRKAP